MKIGDLVVCQPSPEKDYVCPFVGKVGTIFSTKLDKGKIKFKVKTKEGLIFPSPKECLITLEDHKKNVIKECGADFMKIIANQIDNYVSTGNIEAIGELAKLCQMHRNHTTLTTMTKDILNKAEKKETLIQNQESKT